MAATLGIDIGTTSVKVSIVEHENRTILCSKNVNHSMASEVRVDQGFVEQKPLEIFKKVDKCMTEVEKAWNKGGHGLVCSYHIARVVITGQMHGVVLWSIMHGHIESPSSSSLSSSSVTKQTNDFSSKEESCSAWIYRVKKCVTFETNLITWEDKRCSNDFIHSLPRSCSPLYSGYGCATLFWLLRNEHAVTSRSNCCGSIMDAVVSSLCSLDQPIMSDQLANSWGYFDKDNHCWESYL